MAGSLDLVVNIQQATAYIDTLRVTCHPRTWYHKLPKKTHPRLKYRDLSTFKPLSYHCLQCVVCDQDSTSTLLVSFYIVVCPVICKHDMSAYSWLKH